MYQRSDSSRTARTAADGLPTLSALARARLAVAQIHKALTDATPGAILDTVTLHAALTVPAADPEQEAERRFCLGWLHWLAGDPDAAEPHLDAALATEQLSPELRLQTTYWLAR